MLCETVQLIQSTISIAAGNLQKCHPTEGESYPLPTTEVYKVIYCCIYYAAVLRVFIAQHTQRFDCHSVRKMAVRFLQGFIRGKHQPGLVSTLKGASLASTACQWLRGLPSWYSICTRVWNR